MLNPVPDREQTLATRSSQTSLEGSTATCTTMKDHDFVRDIQLFPSSDCRGRATSKNNREVAAHCTKNFMICSKCRFGFHPAKLFHSCCGKSKLIALSCSGDNRADMLGGVFHKFDPTRIRWDEALEGWSLGCLVCLTQSDVITRCTHDESNIKARLNSLRSRQSLWTERHRSGQDEVKRRRTSKTASSNEAVEGKSVSSERAVRSPWDWACD